MSWSPKRSLAESEALLTAPGTPHETQTRVIDGQVLRVYKNLWPSLRLFWLWAANEHKAAIYTVFENQRYTFSEIFDRSLKAAAMFQDVYGIRKGDRIALCSRNYPDYLTVFWACHLIGAVSVLPNAWSPLDVLSYCFAHTDSKLIIVDSERATTLEPIVQEVVSETGCSGILVLEAHEGKGQWNGMKSWDAALKDYSGDYRKILTTDPGVSPEDNATVLFTSGTTGRPKGVLSTQRQFLSNVPNVLAGGRRAAFRRGETPSLPPPGPQKGILCAVPLFHVTGLTSLAMLSTMGGLKFAMMRKWDPIEGSRLIKAENLTIAGGVPSMVSDLTDSASGAGIEALMFGGAPAPELLADKAHKAFPTAALSQGYGLTETSSVVVGFSGEDYLARSTSCGLPTPINDVIIVKGDVVLPAGEIGEVWLRGPNVMKGYWKDPEATAKALTKDGWFKTGDLGYLDKEGFLYIRDRIKDIIIRGGENIDSVTVENALYADERLLEVAAVGVPDKRLGELVAAVVSTKPGYNGKVSEQELIALTAKRLPKFAVPVMIIVQSEPLERTPSGKILKPLLRQLAAAEWARRSSQSTMAAKL